MINFIKMDLRRLFKSLSFYVLLGIFMFIIGMTIYSNKNTIKKNIKQEDSQQTQEMVQGENDENVHGGLGTNTDSMLNSDITFSKYISVMYRGNTISFFIMMLIVMFLTTEYQSGYIKNIATISKYRWYNVISKIITGVVATIVFNLIGGFALFVAVEKIFIVGSIGSTSTILKMVATQTLIEAAIVALAVFIGTTIRSKSFSITLSVLISTSMITIPLCLLIGKIFDVKVEKVFSYTLLNQMSRITCDASQKVYTQASVIAMIFLTVCTVFSCVLVQKRDI